MKSLKFMVTDICPGTDRNNPRAKMALRHPELFPLIVDVKPLHDGATCINCGSSRYVMTAKSQASTERIFGFHTHNTRTVCEGMGFLIK
jgi:hypothetical protein